MAKASHYLLTHPLRASPRCFQVVLSFSPFRNKVNDCLDTLILLICVFSRMKVCNVRGDLTDMSANNASLVIMNASEKTVTLLVVFADNVSICVLGLPCRGQARRRPCGHVPGVYRDLDPIRLPTECGGFSDLRRKGHHRECSNGHDQCVATIPIVKCVYSYVHTLNIYMICKVCS